MTPFNIHIELESGGQRDVALDRSDQTIADVIAEQGIEINTRCGGRGLCHGCEVRLRSGTVETGGRSIAAPATVQACQSRLNGPASLVIPARSMFSFQSQPDELLTIDVAHCDRPLFPVRGERDTSFAIDIGTTTVEMVLVDTASGTVLARAGSFNRQLQFGDNVLTRIDAARDPKNLAAMNHAIVAETIEPILSRACDEAARSRARIAGGVIAGNTTMLHLILGEDPTPIGIAPFTPKFLEARRIDARELGLSLPPDTPIQLLPGMAAYIGADIVAGVAASGMSFDSESSLLADLGTNGEIVLQTAGKLIACATAAGPAFEGCGLSCGMPAQPGAVCGLKIELDPFDVRAQTIGDVPLEGAAGLCGSAYIDFLALGRRCGLLEPTGRFNAAAWERIPARHRRIDRGSRALAIGNLQISEADVALLLQAKAAIGAGLETLLGSAGLDASALGRVYLGGGFGNRLNVAHAISIGLLPGIRADQIRVIGNSALAGACLALVDSSAIELMNKMRTEWEVLDLSVAPGFEDKYVDHLLLP